ncbi:protein kinase [Streptomyces cinnabarinus]|uniref:non-specific serine/threonine protein kinase n=2 Tax=Streptomyces cinnabarinus TaxID=67287 RepID=A0ABY7KUI2_9ACTN|nr:serine/threonine protein kinase [Streptomyces cinnabarinus]WAZ27087.1 protein kinase [Streptomyces cinnabarinus]
MGRVWRAADEILDRPVAIKEMRIDGLDAEDTRTRRERTLREARATARIDHPNVVRVYDVVDEGERLWIVMELVAGRSLERLIVEDGPLSPSEAARIGLGLVAALRQVHERGVLHRDIKPGNVLVETGARRVVLTDFGIAAIQDAKALTMVGMLVGSPDYMAPERISGRPQGPPSDIWSLGATLCAALGGRSPFSRDTTLATLHAVLYEEPELPPGTGPLTAVLAALLEKEPDTRPSLTDLEDALHPIAFPAPTPTVTVGTPGEPQGDTGQPETAAPAPSVGPEWPEAAAPEGTGEPQTAASVGTTEPDPAEPPRSEQPTPGPDPRDLAPPEPADTPPTEAPRAEPPEDPRPTRDFGRRAIPRTPNASTEAASEARSEVRSEVGSETPAPHPRAGASSTTGVSLIRTETGTETDTETRARAASETKPAAVQNAEAETEHRPAPTRAATPTPVPTPTPSATPDAHPTSPGELPGPAVPTPRPARRHRPGVLAAVGLVTVGAVVAVVLVLNSGSPDDDKAGGSTPSSASSAAQNSPSPTVEGTSRPQSLPPGARTEAGGFAWVTPEGWRRDVKTGAEVHYTSPDGKQELVAKSSLARGDLMETWETSEQNAHQGQAYRKIRLEETTFRGYPAVEWEYTFTLKGVPWHARLLGFNEKGKSYQINTWYQPDIETEALRTYEEVKDSFTIL